MGQISLAECRLTALFVECILYGFYFITFAYTTQVLLSFDHRPRQFHEVNKPVFIGTTTLFAVVTGNLVLNFYQSLRAFIFSKLPTGAELEYGHISGWVNVVQTSFVLFGTLIGDWILLHRCWILWNQMWRWIFVPSVLWIGCLFCAIRVTILEASFKGQGVFNSPTILPYGSAFWATSILINTSTTVLTIYRIWLVEETNKQSGLQPVEVDEFPRSTMHFIICITVESGLLNTLAAIATFVTYVIEHNSVYIMTGIELPVAGIACNLIILRASRRTKRLLKAAFKRTSELEGFDSVEAMAGAPDTIPISIITVNRTTDIITLSQTNPTVTTDLLPTTNQRKFRSRIEELPYP